jgi:hypothetical protein
MALAEDILAVRYGVGDVPNNIFYPLIPDDAYEGFLTRTNNDISQSTKLAAVSISFMIAGWNSREQVGDLSITNDFARNYLRVLQTYLSTPSMIVIPQGLFPWSGAVDTSNKLLDFNFCGEDSAGSKRCS